MNPASHKFFLNLSKTSDSCHNKERPIFGENDVLHKSMQLGPKNILKIHLNVCGISAETLVMETFHIVKNNRDHSEISNYFSSCYKNNNDFGLALHPITRFSKYLKLFMLQIYLQLRRYLHSSFILYSSFSNFL